MKDPKKNAKLNTTKIKKLQDEVLELRRLLKSIQAGEVDALVIKNKTGQESIFTLEGEDQPYRLLIESLSEGALTLQRDGTIVHCNKRFATMVNLEAKNIIGTSIFDYLPTEQHQKLQELINLNNNGETQEEFTLAQGDKITKIILFSCNDIKLGAVKGLSIVATDITQLSNEYHTRIKVQEELIKQENLFRHFTKIIDDVFWMMPPEMDRLIYVSPAYEKVWGRSLKSLYANPMEWKTSVVKADQEKVDIFLNKLLYQEYAYEHYTIITPEGLNKIIFVKGFQNKDENGKVLSIIGIASDVTELTGMQNQLHLDDKLRMVGVLSASVAHEINNPISWILGNLSFIKKNAAKLNGKELEELMDESIEGIDRIREIIQSLKGFARVNDNELSFVNMSNIIDEALKIAAPEIKINTRLEKNYEKNLPLVKGNSGKLQQVFLNLIMNAVQAMPKENLQDNLLRITTTHEGNQVRVDVSDTGYGIEPVNLTKIFDPFYTTKAVNIGSGLGLSISHEIIKNLGGEIKVKSIVGKGTTFSVFLPTEAKVENTDQNSTSTTAQVTRKQILVVDDEPNLLSSIKRMLENKYDITIATNAGEAINLIAKTDFDIILTDLNMPGLDGADFYNTIIDSFPRYANRTILMSGSGHTESVKDLIVSKHLNCLDKPFTREEALEMIEKMLKDFVS